MKFFHWRHEGEECRPGFNFYRPNDRGSIGFVFVLGKLYLRARWSKVTKRMFIKIRREQLHDLEFDNVLQEPEPVRRSGVLAHSWMKRDD